MATTFTDAVTSPHPPDELSGTWQPESFEPERIKNLIAELTPAPEVIGERTFGVHILSGDDPLADIGRSVEASAFMEFFRNDLDVMRKAYGPFDEVSTLVAVVDYANQEPAGALRIVRPSEKGIITLDELQDPKSPWYDPNKDMQARVAEVGDPNDTLDIATMAVMPRYRNKHQRDSVSAALYATCVQVSLGLFENSLERFDHWVTIVDHNIFEMMQSWGQPFEVFEGADFAPYMGSKASIPVHLQLSSALERVKAFDQGIYDLYTKSAGLEGQFVLPEVA